MLPTFTEAELFQAYAIFLNEADARDAARATAGDIEEARRAIGSGERHGDDAEAMTAAGYDCFGVSLSTDLLIALSLLNKDAEMRVAKYREERNENIEGDSRWEARRKEVAVLIGLQSK